MLDFRELYQAIGNLEDEKVAAILQEFVATEPTRQEALELLEVCQKAMSKVGENYEKGEFFLADLIFAGKILSDAMEQLKPLVCTEAQAIRGKILIGTVHGDLHDIGKNIFIGLAKTAGFETHDLGIDVPVATFIKNAKALNPEIIGLSGILTVAVDAMKETVLALRAAGITAKIIIGGLPVNQEVGEEMGADGYTNNAAQGVKICQGWV